MSDIKLPNMEKARFRDKNYRAEIVRNALKLTDQQKAIGVGSFYHVISYGCQGNVRDGEVISGILEEMGYQHTDLLEMADIIILNTCAVRENAEQRVMGEIGFLQNYKYKNPNLIIGISGCMPQEEVVVKRIIKAYPSVQLVFGTHNIYQLPEMIENIIVNNQRSISVESKQGNIYEGLASVRNSQYKAYVNIMDGCDKFCTYCIVPYTRGQQRSRLKSDIIAEVKDLYNNGFKEVMLLGQNVNAYGKDLDDGDTFAELLQEVADIGIPRIRFLTSHPWDFTDEMILTIDSRKNIMPYIHLPVQAGDDEILKLMGRRYTQQQYLELFDKIKNNVPDVAISTDIIVGFPNETEEQFNETLKVVEYCQYDSAFSFIYSPRSGTPAANMEDSITLAEKKDRLQRLNARLDYYSKLNNQKWEGKTVEVLIDGTSKNNSEVYAGYTPQNKLVNFILKDGKVGDKIEVEIEKAMKNSLNGAQK